MLVAGLLLSACGGGDGSGDGDEAEAVRVGVVYDVGGLGTGGLNDSAFLGFAKAEDQLGIELQELEPDATGSDRETLIRAMAEDGLDLVVSIGPGSRAAVEDVADDHLDQRFFVVDDGFLDVPNATSIEFAEEEGAYLVGAAAALTSPTKHVGFLAGTGSDATPRYEAGFRAGARKVQPEGLRFDRADVPAGPDGAPGDANAAKAAAVALFGTGADVVLGAPRGVGAPLFSAAAELGRKAIGSEADDVETADPAVRSAILTSVVKHVDVALYAALDAFVDGRLDAGERRVGLASGAVGFADSGGRLPPEVLARLEELQQQIVDGQIRIPTVP